MMRKRIIVPFVETTTAALGEEKEGSPLKYPIIECFKTLI